MDKLGYGNSRDLKTSVPGGALICVCIGRGLGALLACEHFAQARLFASSIVLLDDSSFGSLVDCLVDVTQLLLGLSSVASCDILGKAFDLLTHFTQTSQVENPLVGVALDALCC
jgi:hypothetical protein